MNYRQLISSMITLDNVLFLRSYYTLILVLWLFLVQLSRIIVRYGKIIVPLYINIHSILMTFICLLTILYISIYFSLFGIQFQTTIQKIKTIFTFAMLFFIVVQMGMGIVCRIAIFGTKYVELNQTIKSLHKNFGYFMILFSRVIISLVFVEEYLKNPGEKTVEDERMKAWFFVFGSLYFLIVVVQFLHRSVIPVFVKRNIEKAKNNTLPEEMPEESFYHEVAREIEKGQSLGTILLKYPHSKFVIYNNRIFQIEQFIHPGGQFIIEEVMGQEINHLISGGHSTFLTPLKHQHTIYVEKYFQQKPSVLLKYEPIIVKKDLLQSEEKLWKTRVSSVFGQSSTALFNFTSEGFHIRNHYHDIREFGKYFMLEAYTESYQTIKRPYSIILSMTQESICYRKILKQLYTNRANTNLIENIGTNQYSEILPLIIKYYYGGQLTSILKNIPQTKYRISGPYGAGLRLSPLFVGHIVVISGGTGILPFLDLFDYLYRNLVLVLLQKTFGHTQVQRLNPLKINYNMVSNISVKLYASFKNQFQFYGESLLLDLYKLSKSLNQQVFDMELRFSEGNYYEHGMKVKIEHIGEVAMKGIINSNAEKVYVCGTPQMNKEIVQMFLDMGGNEETLCVL